MKKLFALLLALGMLCSFAMAEEAEAIELSWDSVSDEVKALGSFQQVDMQDLGKIIYWVPQNMEAQDVSEIGAEGLVAAFATADQEYTISVYGLVIADGWEAYVAGLGVTEENAKLVITNGIQAIGFEQEEQGVDMVIIPVNDTTVLVYAFTPLNGDEDWDQVKGAIVASIQAAE